jgi:transcriptional regulator with XRE-family HTH domain
MKNKIDSHIKIVTLLKERKITQLELAKMIMVDPASLSRSLSGTYRISLHTLRKISKALNKPLSYFINDDIKEQTNDNELLKKELENQNLRIKLLEKEIELLKK